MHLVGALRNLERLADHATNIAEDVIFLTSGRIVRHHMIELSRQSPEERQLQGPIEESRIP